MRPSFSARNELALSVLNFILHDIKQEFLSIRIAIFSLQRCCLLRLFFSCEHYTLPVELGLVRCCELLKKVKTELNDSGKWELSSILLWTVSLCRCVFFVQLCDVGFHNWNSLCFSTPFFISTSHSFSTLVDGAECALSWQKLSLTFIACVPPPRGGWQLFFFMAETDSADEVLGREREVISSEKTTDNLRLSRVSFCAPRLLFVLITVRTFSILSDNWNIFSPS